MTRSLAVAIALYAPSAAYAQQLSEGASNIVQFLPAEYAQYSPQTALDMALRTPGFALDEGNADLRGFGGGAGNVLIDGQRPSSKTSVTEALARIPASQVERIELLRNASTAEAQGQAVVLNVVRKPNAASGTWSVELERNANNVVYPRVEASRTATIAGWETSVRGRAYWEEFPFRRTLVLRDAAGQITSSVRQDLPSTVGEAYVSGEAKRDVGGGTLTLNGRVGWYDYHYELPGQVWLGQLPGGEPDQRLMDTLGLDRMTYEYGADYVRDIGGWSWKALALATARPETETQFSGRYGNDGALLSSSILNLASNPVEAIGRVTTTPVSSDGFKPEFGAELAYNRLDSELELSSDTGSGPVTIELPAADIVVQESRADVFANATWAISPDWTVEGGLAVETSEISVSGDADQSQRFTFFKPSAAIAWRAVPGLLLRAEVRRTIDQLNFSDFAASANLDDEISAGGNPDLGPSQRTRWALSADWRGEGDLALNLELFQEDRTDVLEQIILPSGAPGLANAGDGVVRGAKATFTLPLDILLAGARLTGVATVRDSEFYDPQTGEVRALTGTVSPDTRLEFRHDPPGLRFSWGTTYWAPNESEAFFVDMTSPGTGDENWSIFAETTAVESLLMRLSIRNAGTQRTQRFRAWYDPDRSGVVDRTEHRRTRMPMYVTFTVSGQF